MEIITGDFTIIMGASGSGKSTLLYALSGMDKPSMGKVFFGDKEIQNYSNDQLAVFRRGNCGFVFQSVYLLENQTVLDNGSNMTISLYAMPKIEREKVLALSDSINNWNQVSEQANNGLETLINLL